MLSPAVWITGGSLSGKTTRLIELFCEWTPLLGETNQNSEFRTQESATSPSARKKTKGKRRGEVPLSRPLTGTTTLIFAANSDNRMVLAERLTAIPQGQYSFYSTTPLGFFQDEVILFWPLLVETLGLKAQ